MCSCTKCKSKETPPDVRSDLLPSHSDGLVIYRSVGTSVHIAVIGKAARQKPSTDPSTPAQATI